MTSSILDRVCRVIEAIGKIARQKTGMIICRMFFTRSVNGDVYPWTGNTWSWREKR
jgi:hypothetical protein